MYFYYCPLKLCVFCSIIYCFDYQFIPPPLRWTVLQTLLFFSVWLCVCMCVRLSVCLSFSLSVPIFHEGFSTSFSTYSILSHFWVGLPAYLSNHSLFSRNVCLSVSPLYRSRDLWAGFCGNLVNVLELANKKVQRVVSKCHRPWWRDNVNMTLFFVLIFLRETCTAVEAMRQRINVLIN